MNYFEYNGVRSSDMGLRIESKNVFSAPKYDTTLQPIPGRDGDLILPNGRYPNVQVAYTVFLPAKSISSLAEKITAVKAWLYTEPDRYHSLADSYDTTCTRQAVFASQLDIEDQLNKIGLFTVSFSCKPFRYLTSGKVAVTCDTTGDTITNPTPFPAKPYLKVSGSGAGALTIQAAGHNATWNFPALDGFIEIDSDMMNFYKGMDPLNDQVTGSGFPVLYPGENTIGFSGGVSSVEITPRWVTL